MRNDMVWLNLMRKLRAQTLFEGGKGAGKCNATGKEQTEGHQLRSHAFSDNPNHSANHSEKDDPAKTEPIQFTADWIGTVDCRIHLPPF